MLSRSFVRFQVTERHLDCQIRGQSRPFEKRSIIRSPLSRSAALGAATCLAVLAVLGTNELSQGTFAVPERGLDHHWLS